MKNSEPKLKLIIFGILASFAIGYTMGFTAAANWCAEQAVKFIDIDKTEIARALMMYKNNIESFVPLNITNASILHN